MDSLYCIYSKIKQTSEGVGGGPVGIIINSRKEYAYLLFSSKDDAKELIKTMKLSNVQVIDITLLKN
jgi:hypothetical protein